MAEVQFVSAVSTDIQLNLDTAEAHVTVQSGGILIVEPHPDGDHISCDLKSGVDRVDTVIKLPRIWWRMVQDDRKADEWCAVPLAMTRQEFREYADIGAGIQLRLPRRISSVKVGFDEELDRTHRSQKNRDNTETEIHLSDFIDYDQIDQRLSEDALLNAQCGADVVALIRVSADLLRSCLEIPGVPRARAKARRTRRVKPSAAFAAARRPPEAFRQPLTFPEFMDLPNGTHVLLCFQNSIVAGVVEPSRDRLSRWIRVETKGKFKDSRIWISKRNLEDYEVSINQRKARAPNR